MDYHYKIHFPSCGCKYNKASLYSIDAMDRTTKKYTRTVYSTFSEIKDFIDNNKYSVCIHPDTPQEFLNGGIIFITTRDKAQEYLKDFKTSSEITQLYFYTLKQLKDKVDKKEIPEYHNFTPIKDSIPLLYGTINQEDLVVLICQQKDRDGNTIFSFPKGKRLLSEYSIECGIREFREETGIKLADEYFEELYQLRVRKEYNIYLPRLLRIFNCLFQIILHADK